jgi:hypothetical protein
MPERKRVCFLLHVRKDRLAKYKERHKSVWPEMRQALRRHSTLVCPAVARCILSANW